METLAIITSIVVGAWLLFILLGVYADLIDIIFKGKVK